MKKFFKGVVILSLIISFALPLASANAYVQVKGYRKANGTYVAPHVRSNPNGLRHDNYSYTPSQARYNSTYGTRGSNWDTPTYITDRNYNAGRNIYNSNQRNSYSLPSYKSNLRTPSMRMW